MLFPFSWVFFLLKMENIIQAHFIPMSSISLWFIPKHRRSRDASACSLPALAGTSGWGGSLVCGLSLRSRLASFGSQGFISVVCMGATDRRFWTEICKPSAALSALEATDVVSCITSFFNQLHVNKQAAVGFNFAVASWPSAQAGTHRLFFLIFLLQLTWQTFFHSIKMILHNEWFCLFLVWLTYLLFEWRIKASLGWKTGMNAHCTAHSCSGKGGARVTPCL